MTQTNILEARNLVLSVCEVKQRGAIPEPRVDSRMITLGPKCFLIGGFNERCTLGGSYILDIENTTWSTVEHKKQAHPPPILGHSLSRHEHQLLLFGGAQTKSLRGHADASDDNTAAPPTSGISLTNALWIYDVDGSKWSKVDAPAELQPRMYHASVIYSTNGDESEEESFLLIDGGFDGTQILSDLWALELSSHTWHKVEQSGTAPSSRFGHTLTYVPSDDSIVLLGGTLNETISAYSMKISFEDGTASAVWSKVISRCNPPSDRIFHSAILMRPKWIFIFGGYAADQNCSSYIYDLGLERWCRPLAEGTMPLQGHASTQLTDKLLVFSGARRTNLEALKSVRLEDFLRPDKIFDLVFERSMKLTRKLMYCTVLELRGPSQNTQYKFKIVTVGDTAVGKSCLLLRFVTDTYHDLHMATVGTDCSSIVTLVGGKLCTLQMWDTAGQERFAGLSGAYFRDADGFALVFDMCRRKSFEHISDWIDTIKEHHPLGAESAIVLIGNKADLSDHRVTTEEAEKLAKSINACFVKTSAKTAENVDLAFLDLATKLLSKRQAAGLQKSSQSTAIGHTLRLGEDAENEGAAMGLLCPSLRCGNG